MMIHRAETGVCVKPPRIRWLAFALGICALVLASSAEAVTGTGTLSADPADGELLRVECFDDGSGAPVALVARVEDMSASSPPFVSVQVVKGNAATNATDPVHADGSPSPAVFIDGGAGEYDVWVDKSGSGEKDWQLTLSCTTGAGGTGVETGILVPGWVQAVPLGGPGVTIGLGGLLGALSFAVLRREQTRGGRQ